jgi:acyl carrier protein
MMNNDGKLRQVFIDALALEPGIEVENLSYRGIKEWDSVAHMLLVGEIENAFDIMLETQDVIDMSSYSLAREIIRKYGVQI